MFDGCLQVKDVVKDAKLVVSQSELDDLGIILAERCFRKREVAENAVRCWHIGQRGHLLLEANLGLEHGVDEKSDESRMG